MAISSPELTQISILGRILRCIKLGGLQARVGLNVVCTITRFTFIMLIYPIAFV